MVLPWEQGQKIKAMYRPCKSVSKRGCFLFFFFLCSHAQTKLYISLCLKRKGLFPLPRSCLSLDKKTEQIFLASALPGKEKHYFFFFRFSFVAKINFAVILASPKALCAVSGSTPAAFTSAVSFRLPVSG